MFQRGHKIWSGRKHTEAWKRDASIRNRGQNNANWKNKVTYAGLHKYIRENLPKSELCQICNIVPSHEIACVTHIYNRDFINWKRVCVSCHRKHDNSIKNLGLYGIYGKVVG